MSDTLLRSDLIRLATAKPELREHLLPLLNKQAAFQPFGPREVSLVSNLAQRATRLAKEPLSESMARDLMATGARLAHLGGSVLRTVAESSGDEGLKQEAQAALALTMNLSKKFPRV